MTIGADVKALIDGAGTSLTAVYREGWVPDDAGFPYGSFLDPISDAPVLSGDAETLASRRLIQVDLYQDEATEDDGLVDAVVGAIDGKKSATTGWRFRVIEITQVPADEDEEDVVHHALTISTVRLR